MNALSIRCDYALLQVLVKCGITLPSEEVPFTLQDVETEAYLLGQSSISEDPPLLFHNTCLARAWKNGHQAAQDFYESLPAEGTQEEWEALSDEEKSNEWDTFHDLNARGIADDMYFYRILMDAFLKGYVGH